MAEALEEGRAAARRHEWEAAAKALAAADEAEGLGPDDLVLLADATWWSGDPDTAVIVLERAFAEYERSAQVAEAATVGAQLAYLAMRRSAMSIAMGWVARIERLLQGQPESVGHAWLKVFAMVQTLFAGGDLDLAIRLAEEALELGQRHASSAIRSIALSFKGYAMIERGEWREGLVLIDEATAVAMSEGADLRAASDVYCNTIAVCRNLADYRRAEEWTEQAERWMRSNSVGGYPGICKVHRAELKRLHGSWSEAEEEARKACTELERFRLMDGIGFAHYEVGEVRRRMGDLKGAEEAFIRAYENGTDPQPGRALLLLERGETEEAARAIATALQRISGVDSSNGAEAILARARLLSAQVEINLELGDVDTARTATEELERVADLYESPAWRASASGARGAVDLHEGHLEQAVASLDRAWRLWREIDLPYENARTRTILGTARLEAGDEQRARMEFGAARSIFERLGATTELRRLNEITGEESLGRPDGRHRVTRAFMFTDIVTSTDLLGLMGDDAWEELLRWHDRTLRTVFADNDGEEVKHTGDGFFVAFDEARAAVECAVAIQRRLEAHRREHGFAPWVRIGIHSAEAFEQQGDYSGHGVHVAARIGALGDRDDIVVSADVVEAVGPDSFPMSGPRSVNLKGVPQPMEVRNVDWR
ncbi:MAG TPA: adenylate/guanylate cyclase domain-containing protein [Acidimicrobiia bacterium]|nr:adenylate/guanylate cyclase domain-containing protein [Acidimicrobiia bacterium]